MSGSPVRLRLSWRVLAALAVAVFASLVVAQAAADTGGKVTVRGHRLYVACTGTGSPAVLLESGLGGTHLVWDEATKLSAKLGVRICSYDRYGLGQSSSRKQVSRTIEKAALDLRALSRAKQLAPPYVVAGHSMGGLIVREYAKLFPADVAGMVLLDSAPDDWDVYTRNRWYSGGGELLDLKSASKSLRASDALGAKPLVVLEAEDVSGPRVYSGGDPKFQQYWDARQRALARISSSSLFAVAVGHGHELPGEAPELTAAALALVVNAVRTHAALPSCAASPLVALGARC
jgi:pimeloyl-ACP methyl ester carboxylesterase